MCGASSTQNELSQEELQAYQENLQLTQQQYQNQQAIYGPLIAPFQSIFAKGPSQEGYSDAELEDLDATAVEGTAENYGQAAKAVAESTAAEGGGTNPLPSGAQTELKQEVANSAASQESKEESDILSSDYATGRSNWLTAAQNLEEIGAGENPLGFEEGATSSANTANTEANTVQAANDSWLNAALGVAGEIGGGWAEGGFKTHG